MRHRLLTALAIVGLTRVALAYDVTTCGQTVPAGEVGEVLADLSCTTSAVVELNAGAELNLNGHTLESTGTSGFDHGVACNGHCRVTGPGTITQAKFAVSAFGGFRVELSDVSIDNVEFGVTTGENGWLFANNTTVSDCSVGVLVGKVMATGLVVTNCNHRGISASRVKGTGIDVSGNGQIGIQAGKVVVTNLTATGNGEAGIEAGAVVLRDSTVTGNNGSGLGIDLRTLRRPVLKTSTCGKSQRTGALLGETWGVCSGD